MIEKRRPPASKETIEEIVQLLYQGKKQKEIAILYDIDVRSVGRIKKKYTDLPLFKGGNLAKRKFLSCITPNCNNQHMAKGYCSSCYQLVYYKGIKHEDLAQYKKDKEEAKIIERKCSVEECSSLHYALGYCRKHYMSFKRYGDPLIEKQRRKRGKNKPPTPKVKKPIKVRIHPDLLLSPNEWRGF